MKLHSYFFLEDKFVDVVFALGASKPNGPAVLELEKEVVHEIIDQLRLLDTQYGVIQYDSNARVVVDVGAISDPQNIKEAVSRMYWSNDGTGLAKVKVP